MRITWLISAQVSGQSPAQWDCPLASVRYRVLAPARFLVEQGHQTAWLRFDQLQAAEIDLQVAARLHADVVVVSKVLSKGSVEAATTAKKNGAKLVVDLCDDHFDTENLRDAYFKLCEMADTITASTAAMAQTIQQRTGRAAQVIDDPFEGPLGEPTFCPLALSDRIKLVWFGHPVNFDTVLSMLPGLKKLSSTVPLELHIVTDETAAQQSPLFGELHNAVSDRLQLKLTPWSLAATWQGLAQCDLVVVPSLPEQKKQVKSPNRVVEGIRAGRMVIAYPLPAYVELRDYLWLGEEIADGIRWAIANPQKVLEQITQGQLAIGRRFSPRTIGGRWEALLQQVVENEPILL
jgi:glycosyltransferase involved in cell wall biosynthesis